jgi:hypothetical protein
MDQGMFETLGALGTPTTLDLSVPGFAIANADLLDVKITVTSNYGGNGGAENVSTVPGDLTLQLGADIGIVGPGLSNASSALDVFASLALSPNSPFMASAFDGTIDYAGTSGFEDTFNTVTNMQMLTPTGFSGYLGGLVNFTLDSQSLSIANGPGDVNSFFRTFGDAKVTVEYEYECRAGYVGPGCEPNEQQTVPEPSALIALGIVGGLGFLKKLGTKA